ncbi:hypothetical protein [Nocardia sp. NBC_01503]|uniref:hypothetical protein n=1 Tax=Nocardia sp. NBC_01503 TaxID=2975997 RepID=UPI002E7BD905|nr:hypothetical protein [Nocardia sp. NBC_01503]
MAQQLVGHFVDKVIPYGTLPGDVVSGDVTAVTRVCLELAVDMLDGQDTPAKVERLAEAAAGWAREGAPIGTILHSIHGGFKFGMDLISENSTARDHGNLMVGAKRVVEMLDAISVTVANAYVREHKAVVSEHHNAP